MTTSATRHGARSFTLLELVLVVALIGLISTMALPMLSGLGRRLGVQSANYELLWLLRQARWWSARTGRACLVRLRPTETGYDAEVSYLDRDGQTTHPLRADWTTLAELPNIQQMVRIPPDRDMMLKGELTVRFRPWGVSEDYMIQLAAIDGQEPARIEVRRPNGLVWLLPGDQASPFDPEHLAAIESHWRTYCREATGSP